MQKQPRDTHFRFNSKPEVSNPSKFVEANPKKMSEPEPKPTLAAFQTGYNRSRFPEYFENAVLNPATGQSFLFKKTVRNDSKLKQQNKYVFQRKNIPQVSPSVKKNQGLTESNLISTSVPPPCPNLSVPPPKNVIKPCQRPHGRNITKKPEPFFTPSPNLCRNVLHTTNSQWKVFKTEVIESGNTVSFRSILKDTSKKVNKMGTSNKFDKCVKFTFRKVQYLPKSKQGVQINEEMRFLPISAKIPERYPYDVIRASGQLWKIKKEFFKN